MMTSAILIGGARLHKTFLDRLAQERMRDAIREVIRAAPLYAPRTPWDKPMSVKMTSAGKFGWMSDRKGYRYEPRHPSGVAWPPIPPEVLAVWESLAEIHRKPECCLINWYGPGARMGLHQDKDEADFDQPVVSISLGDTGVFRIGGPDRSDATTSTLLESGDVLVMGGEARLAYHGVDRIKAGTSTLLKGDGRLNLTLRVVT